MNCAAGMMNDWKRLGILGPIAGMIGLVCMLALWGLEAEAAAQADTLLEALERGPGPALGSPDAQVTIVEFSDFQCGYCRKFWQDTLPRIEEKYIRTG